MCFPQLDSPGVVFVFCFVFFILVVLLLFPVRTCLLGLVSLLKTEGQPGQCQFGLPCVNILSKKDLSDFQQTQICIPETNFHYVTAYN